MKKIIPLLICILVNSIVHAQTYSAWIADSKHPNLKVRYKTIKDNQNYSYIQMEIISTVRCRMYVTASYCNTDAKEKNGWQFTALGGQKSVIRRFKILNSCANGFWWWYKDYKVETID
jgi:hypothetical protein